MSKSRALPHFHDTPDWNDVMRRVGARLAARATLMRLQGLDPDEANDRAVFAERHDPAALEALIQELLK